MAIAPLTPAVRVLELTLPHSAKPKAEPGSEADFSNTLASLMGSVETSSGDANRAVSSMLQGTGDVHDAMIALQRAEMTLELTVQVRNKLVQAYQDLMRMPV